MANVIEELKEAKKNLPYLERIYFDDDAFILVSTEDIREFTEGYKEYINLPLSVTGITPATLRRDKLELLVDAGVSFQAAASVLAFMTAVAAVGRVIGGYLGDKFGLKRTLVVCFFLMSGGVIVLATAQTVAQALVFAILYGLGYGARGPLLIALRGRKTDPHKQTVFITLILVL